MKNWLWVLGISVTSLIACAERGSVGNSTTQLPIIAESVNDTPPPVPMDVDSDYQEDQNNGNDGGSFVGPPNRSLEPKPDRNYKDFPGKTRSDFFTGNQVMVDSTNKALMARNHIRDSIARANHPMPDDTMKSQQHR